jgi:hypothetical protein
MRFSLGFLFGVYYARNRVARILFLLWLLFLTFCLHEMSKPLGRRGAAVTQVAKARAFWHLGLRFISFQRSGDFRQRLSAFAFLCLFPVVFDSIEDKTRCLETMRGLCRHSRIYLGFG